MEKVLVFDTSKLKKFEIKNNEDRWISIKQKDIDTFLNECLTDSFYLDREKAETDIMHKQIIPYCIIRKGNKILLYKRSNKGGEKRLHDLWSFGIGGHINPEDGVEDKHVAFGMALQREITEELSFSDPELMEKAEYEITSLLYDKSNSVGRVHFGVIVEIEIPEEIKVSINSDEIEEFIWATVEDLLEYEFEDSSKHKYELESWSEAIFLNYLEMVTELIREV